jgi:hypothetical protein
VATAGETEGLEAHRFQRDVAGEHVEVRPAELGAIFLLDRPQQATGLVEAGIIRPAVERGEALLAATGAAAPVRHAIGAGAMPGEANEEAAIMAEIRRPPILRVGHQRRQIGDHRVEIEGLERLGIIELGAHRVGARIVLVERLEPQIVRPPVPIGAGLAAEAHRALSFRNRVHVRLLCLELSCLPSARLGLSRSCGCLHGVGARARSSEMKNSAQANRFPDRSTWP